MDIVLHNGITTDLDLIRAERAQRAAETATLARLRRQITAELAPLAARQIPSQRRAGQADTLRHVLDLIDSQHHGS